MYRLRPALIKCHRCGALYSPGDWWTVRRPPSGDTSGRVELVAPIDAGHCPLCREPPQLEPKPTVSAVM
jgi:hypothetical protein